jgi:hypothetical protein
MAADTDRVTELEQELTRLMKEVDRYRTAAEDALQQLDWCIGYFAGSHKGQIARALSGNRSHIRRNLMQRSDQSMPSHPESDQQAS